MDLTLTLRPELTVELRAYLTEMFETLVVKSDRDHRSLEKRIWALEERE